MLNDEVAEVNSKKEVRRRKKQSVHCKNTKKTSEKASSKRLFHLYSNIRWLFQEWNEVVCSLWQL